MLEPRLRRQVAVCEGHHLEQCPHTGAADSGEARQRLIDFVGLGAGRA
jgi:hypothetical protein